MFSENTFCYEQKSYSVKLFLIVLTRLFSFVDISVKGIKILIGYPLLTFVL